MTQLLQIAISRAQALSQAAQDRLASLMLSEIELVEQRPVESVPNTAWDIIVQAFAEVPDEEWRKLPADGAAEHDHYLYGAPKRNS